MQWHDGNESTSKFAPRSERQNQRRVFVPSDKSEMFVSSKFRSSLKPESRTRRPRLCPDAFCSR